MKKYTGKYPWKIKEVHGLRRGVVVVVSNDGRKAEVSAKDTGGRMPEIGDDIRDYSLGVMTIGDDGTVYQNPRAPNPLTRVRVTSPPQRPKGTRAKPSKRLVARRKATQKAPAGYYANPAPEALTKAQRAKFKKVYAVHLPSQPARNAIAFFTKKADAVDAAQEAATRTGKPLAVSAVDQYVG